MLENAEKGSRATRINADFTSLIALQVRLHSFLCSQQPTTLPANQPSFPGRLESRQLESRPNFNEFHESARYAHREIQAPPQFTDSIRKSAIRKLTPASRLNATRRNRVPFWNQFSSNARVYSESHLPRYHEIAPARRYHPVRGNRRHRNGS